MNDSPVDCQNRGVTEPQRDGRAEGEGRIFQRTHCARALNGVAENTLKAPLLKGAERIII